MGAFVRLVSLVGVMSAGFYVLYLAQDQLAQPETLTETVSADADALTLGPPGESSIEVSAAKPNDQFTELGKTDDPWKSAPSEQISESGPSGVSKFTAKAQPTETTVVSADPNNPFSPDGIDFRDSGNSLEEPAVVTTADVSTQPHGNIVLVSNEDPFSEDETPVPAKKDETTKEVPKTESNPFEAADPFGEDVKKPEPVKTEEKPLEDFDPFGGTLAKPDKKPEKTPKPEISNDAFPEFDPVSPVETDKKQIEKTEEPPESLEPAPFVSDDPFAPFPDEKPKNGEKPKNTESSDNKTLSSPTLESKDDPFPSLGLDDDPAPKSKKSTESSLEKDPFGDAFPESPKSEKRTAPKTDSSNPVPLDDSFPAFPGEETKTEPKAEPETSSSKEEPFGEFPALDETPEPTPKEKPIAPKPVLDNDPFGEDVSAKPEPMKPETMKEEFPASPDELKEPANESLPETKTPTPELKNDPFGAEFPALDESPTPSAEDGPAKEETKNDNSFPEFAPLEEPVEDTPKPEVAPLEEESKIESLPSIDEFPMLDEKLKENAKEIELKPVPKEEEVPEELPEPNADPEFPGAEMEGEVPSLTELQGDGVVEPDTPREMKLPYLEITKLAPPKAILNKPFVYTIQVKNVGDVAANEVTVQDQIPKGSNLTGTIPQAELVGRRLVWKLGRIEPGQDQKIAVRIVPVEPGPLGSVATVNFVAEVGAETVVEQPQVTFDVTIPEDAKMGEIVDCRFTMTNHGRDVVSGIILRDIIPAGLHHPAGKDLENPLGDLKPGESHTEVLQLKVMKPGRHVNEAILTAEGGLKIRKNSIINASGNRLTVSRRGPKERFVGRPAIYQNVVTNNSKEVVKDSVVIEKLPPGMQFEHADAGGQYHASSQEIQWRVPEIRPGQSVVLQSRMTPTQAGNGQSLVRVLEDQGEQIQMVSHTNIRSYASIGLEMTQLDEPILTGDTVKMRIEATNRGNASAQNVQVRAKIPPTLELLMVRGETRYKREGSVVVFETLNALPAGDTEIIELELKAVASAPAEVAVTIQSQEMKKPVMKASAIEIHNRQ